MLLFRPEIKSGLCSSRTFSGSPQSFSIAIFLFKIKTNTVQSPLPGSFVSSMYSSNSFLTFIYIQDNLLNEPLCDYYLQPSPSERKTELVKDASCVEQNAISTSPTIGLPFKRALNNPQ